MRKLSNILSVYPIFPQFESRNAADLRLISVGAVL